MQEKVFPRVRSFVEQIQQEGEGKLREVLGLVTYSSSDEEQFDQHQEDTMSYPYPKYHYSASKFEEVISKTTSGGGCQGNFSISAKRATSNDFSSVRLQRTISRASDC